MIGIASGSNVLHLTQSAKVDPASLTGEQVTLGASTRPQPVVSVRFSLGSPLDLLQEFTCNFPSYTLRNSGDLQDSWPLPQGTHTVTATPFSSMGATGREGQSLKLTFAISCLPESDAELCQAQTAQCDGIAATDRCGTTRSVHSCGSCGVDFICQPNHVCNNEPLPLGRELRPANKLRWPKPYESHHRRSTALVGPSAWGSGIEELPAIGQEDHVFRLNIARFVDADSCRLQRVIHGL